jgi:hypothetical protein
LQKNKATFGCKLMMMRNKYNGETAYFAIVSNIPYKTAKRVIRNLDGKHINGSIVTVREYRVRNWQNDARQIQRDINSRKVRERRFGDRRNHWVVTEVKDSTHIVIEGIGQFAREY